MKEKGRKLLRPKEAAERLLVCTETLRLWSLSGKLTAEYTKGGRRRYYADEIDSLLTRQNEGDSE